MRILHILLLLGSATSLPPALTTGVSSSGRREGASGPRYTSIPTMTAVSILSNGHRMTLGLFWSVGLAMAPSPCLPTRLTTSGSRRRSTMPTPSDATQSAGRLVLDPT